MQISETAEKSDYCVANGDLSLFRRIDATIDLPCTLPENNAGLIDTKIEEKHDKLSPKDKHFLLCNFMYLWMRCG